MNMTDEQFRALVREMRRVQKLFLKDYQVMTRMEAKRLEAEVDRELAPPPEKEEPTLWGAE